MKCFDVNILVHAHRKESQRHSSCKELLETLGLSDSPFAMSEQVLAGFTRIVTNKKVFSPASSINQALSFIDALTSADNCVLVRPGLKHFQIFRSLITKDNCPPKLVADAYHAALCIEQGLEWLSSDSDFLQFTPELKFTHVK